MRASGIALQLEIYGIEKPEPSGISKMTWDVDAA